MRPCASLSAASACGSQAFSAASISVALTRMPVLARSMRSNSRLKLRERPVAVGAHLVDDAPNRLLHVLRGLALDGEEGGKTLGKIGAAAVQQKWHGVTSWPFNHRSMGDAPRRVNPAARP